MILFDGDIQTGQNKTMRLDMNSSGVMVSNYTRFYVSARILTKDTGYLLPPFSTQTIAADNSLVQTTLEIVIGEREAAALEQTKEYVQAVSMFGSIQDSFQAMAQAPAFVQQMYIANLAGLTLRFDQIQGGLLKVGGLNNTEGVIQILDAAGAVVTEINKDGIKATGIEDGYTISFDKLAGGSLSVGGEGDALGTLTIIDASGNVMATIDKDGVKATSMQPGYTLPMDVIRTGALLVGGENNENGVIRLLDETGATMTEINKDGIFAAGLIVGRKLAFDQIQGGAATLGGANNGDGILEILTEDNYSLVKGDKDGLLARRIYAPKQVVFQEGNLRDFNNLIDYNTQFHIYVSPTGSDDNTGTTIQSPVKTITKALQLLPIIGGGVISLKVGTHNDPADSTIHINRRHMVVFTTYSDNLLGIATVTGNIEVYDCILKMQKSFENLTIQGDISVFNHGVVSTLNITHTGTKSIDNTSVYIQNGIRLNTVDADTLQGNAASYFKPAADVKKTVLYTGTTACAPGDFLFNENAAYDFYIINLISNTNSAHRYQMPPIYQGGYNYMIAYEYRIAKDFTARVYNDRLTVTTYTGAWILASITGFKH